MIPYNYTINKIPEFPKVITKGSVTVRIYEREYEKDTVTQGKRKYVEYTLAWY